MQYKREEVRDMNLYGEILKKLEGTPCLAFERSFVGEEGNLTDMLCELREGAEASEIGKEALTHRGSRSVGAPEAVGMWRNHFSRKSA